MQLKKIWIWICCEICENANIVIVHVDSYWNEGVSNLISWGKVTILRGGDFVWTCMMWFIWKCAIFFKWWFWTSCEIFKNGNLSRSCKIPEHNDSYWKDWISKLFVTFCEEVIFMNLYNFICAEIDNSSKKYVSVKVHPKT